MCSLYSTCPFAHTQMPTTACTTTHAKERNRSIDVARETEKEHRRQIFFEKYRKCCTGTSIYSLYWFDVGWYVSFHTYRQSSCERKRESRVDCDIESCHVWGGGEYFFFEWVMCHLYIKESCLVKTIRISYKWFMPYTNGSCLICECWRLPNLVFLCALPAARLVGALARFDV